MKKIVLALCMLFVLAGCTNNNDDSSKENNKATQSNGKQVTCKLQENDQSGVEVTYTYDDEKKITMIHNVNYLQFTDEDLATTSLDDYYNEIVERYKEAEGEPGVDFKITKDEEKKRVQLDITINIATYNLEDDILNVSNDGEMDNIEELVKLYNAMGVYSCGEVK